METKKFKIKKFFYALSVMVFLLGVSENAWAFGHSNHFFQGNAQVAGTGAGKVYVQQMEITDVASVAEESWNGSAFVTDVLNCNESGDNDYLYFCAKPNTGSHFWGWYEDEACTEVMDDEPETHVNILKIDASGSTEESSPNVVTRYAKFSNEPYPYHWYYATLTAKADPDDGSKGRVQANTSVSDDGRYGNWSRYYMEAESTSDVQKVKNNESSAGIKIYATAMPMHGYTFTGWTTGANTALSEGYDANYWKSAFDVTSTSTDPESPTVGIVTAGFEDALATSVTLLKDANRGTVAVNHKYYYIDGSSVKEYSADLDAFALTEASHTYSAYTKSDVNYEIFPSDRMTLTATPDGDYKFYGWYHEVGDYYEYLGDAATIEITVDEYPNYYAYFDVIGADNAFMVGFHQLATWEEALAAAKANAPCNMLLLKDYIIPAGYYTIPKGVTLIIPKNADQIVPTPNIEVVDSDPANATPSKFRTLTLNNGVTLDVHGTVEVSGTQASGAQGAKGAGVPKHSYGQLIMKDGSKMILENGAVLRAWGFVTGDIANKDEDFNVPHGTIDARRGSTVYEQFQMYDWKGGWGTSNMNGNSNKAFPVTQYFIQNVEVPVTYRPGSALWAVTSVYVSNSTQKGKVQLIGLHGEDALFLMDEKDDSEDTWVRKSYDTSGDIQLYEINSAAQLSAVYLDVSGYQFNSKDYILPITNNLHIEVLLGNLDIIQDVILFPGSSIDIAKQAKTTILPNVSLYLYDQDEWGTYIFSSAYGSQVLYSPTYGGKPNRRDFSAKTSQPDVAVNVHGVMDVKGYLYTTAGGANIYSNDADAGTIYYYNNAPADMLTISVWSGQEGKSYNTTPLYTPINIIPALLRNTDPLYPTTTTAGTPAGQSYCYMNGRWTMMTVDPENECFVKDNYNNYYAKPGAYVQLANGKTENADHTYSDAAGQGRLYILTDECQWWEVVLDNNLYKGITRDAEDVASPNGKYYAYNTTTHKWEEKRYTITWKDWDGTVITTYQLTYGVTPKYLSTNPTREANLDYTYDFTGWSPAIVPVAGDQIYTATYKETPVRYTITFKNSDGTILEHQFLTRGTTPTPPEVTNEDKILQWTPSIGAVTGNQIYTATWLDNRPATWTITWKNYDGSVLDTTTPADGATAETVSAGAPDAPVKPATTEYTYSFTGWTPAVVAATSDATYTASYSEERKTYTVNFYKEGTTNETKSDPANLLVSRTGLYMGGAVTLPDPLPTKSEAGKTFTLQWKNMANDQIVGTGVPAVSGNADYVADFSLYTVSRYTVSVRIQDESGNAVSGCAATGSGTYDHGTEVTINVTPAARFKYWDDDHENTNPQRTFSLTAAQNLTAICVPNENVAIGETVEYDSDETYYDFVISADENHSSQVVGANHVNIATGGHAYFDLTLNTQRRHWRAFTVPFEVDVREHPILADGVSMPLGKQYDIVWYDGAERAANGKTPDCWKYVEDQADWILTPGVAYMIVFGRDVNTVRFTKKDGVSVAYEGTVSVAANSGDDVNGGWNGIGNPATYHALLNAGDGVTTCQVHNGEEIGSDGYITCDMGKFIVGKAVFVQVAASQPVVVNQASSSDQKIAAAPRRAKANATGKNRFDVQIAPADGQMADRMFLHADEYKEDKYVILQDLAKAGLSTKRAQMWVERYDTKLCKNTALLFNGVAEFPLGIFAPQAGEYEISVAESPDEESTLYLTLDGVPVWNLSYGPYTANLEKGTTARYGLKWVRNYVPAISTSVDNTQADKQPTAQKILLNGKVYILRGENVYSADGQLVK